MTIKPKTLLSLIIGAFIIMSFSGCVYRENPNSYSVNRRMHEHEEKYGNESAIRNRLTYLKKMHAEGLLSKEAYEQGMISTVE